MNLYIDIGNSRVKWATSTTNNSAVSNLAKMQSMSYDKIGVKSQFSALCESSGNIINIIACNVASNTIRQMIIDCLNETFKIPIQFIEAQACGYRVINSYEQFADLGNDRWVAIIAAHHLYPSNVCIIDCGTALTIDVVLKNGQHQGGLISPGITTMLQALNQQTNIIDSRYDTTSQSLQLLQNNTHLAIEQGCRRMFVAYLQQTVQQLCFTYNDTLQIIITGGEADSLLSKLPEHWVFIPDLVLQGLHITAEYEMNKL